MYRVLKEDLEKTVYKKMKRHVLTEHHETMRAERSRNILYEIAQCTLPYLVFTDKEKFYIHKDVWPTKTSDLNPLDYSIWSILETGVLATHHTSLESLKAKLQREWEAIPHEQIRAVCDAVVNRLKVVVHTKDGYIE
ncbi:hypothetical protein FHG87_004571 [Trinorchestia longiramus]|nr:hypothetical protein FHG87_004571 [Trinorchestia longiramus]